MKHIFPWLMTNFQIKPSQNWMWNFSKNLILFSFICLNKFRNKSMSLCFIYFKSFCPFHIFLSFYLFIVWLPFLFGFYLVVWFFWFVLVPIGHQNRKYWRGGGGAGRDCIDAALTNVTFSVDCFLCECDHISVRGGLIICQAHVWF